MALPELLLITDRRQCRRPLVAQVTAAVAGGCRWVSVREKDLPPAERLELVRALLPVLRAVGGVLTVHGDAESAARCDGLHLPGGGDVAAARTRLGPGMLVGVSCHSVAAVREAAMAGADYATLSPIFPSASKPGYGPALGAAALAEAARHRLPVLALGGITPANAPACLTQGAAGVAVMGEVMRAGDARAALCAYGAAIPL